MMRQAISTTRKPQPPINEIDVAELRRLLDYDPATGIFRWKAGRGGVRVGDIAGSVDTHGYLSAMICYRNYRLSRVAWALMTGEWPDRLVDHKDTDRQNNKWENLRLATVQQNNANRGVCAHNTSGFKGVSFHKSTGKWRAYLSLNDKYIHLGLFNSKEEAAKAYVDAAQQHYGEFARAA